ncbi:MAG: hypothetical protein E7Z88_01925 [Cyanobacteria bacterium SIG27]|nr:hypothetical protein [Cyanobacteria bacterium SIG27]
MENQIFKYGKDITWSLPILFEHEPAWGSIKKLYREFEIELPQVNGFGCCAMAWTGGREPKLRSELEPKFLLKIYNYCKEMDITPSLTLTYTQLTKDDLKDRYSNYILDMALEIGAHFIVYSDILFNYIKEKDPNAYMVASVIQSQLKFQGENRKNWSIENETNHYNELLKKYDLVVVRPEYSMGPLVENPNLIDDISRIEALINQRCVPNCPRAKQHYLGTESLHKGYEIHDNFRCVLEEIPKDINFLKNGVCHDKETVQMLVDSGVKHLKLQGRGMSHSTEALAHGLFMRIFEIEGMNYHILERLLCGRTNKEIQEFVNYLNS